MVWVIIIDIIVIVKISPWWSEWWRPTLRPRWRGKGTEEESKIRFEGYRGLEMLNIGCLITAGQCPFYIQAMMWRYQGDGVGGGERRGVFPNISICGRYSDIPRRCNLDTLIHIYWDQTHQYTRVRTQTYKSIKIIFGTIYHFPSDPAAISSHKRSYCFVLPDNLLLDQGPAL